MGKLDAFGIAGCTCVFHSNDHPPPHFHVKRPGEWDMRVYFLEDPPRCEMKFEIKKIPGTLRREVQQLAEIHRKALFEEWNAKVQGANRHD